MGVKGTITGFLAGFIGGLITIAVALCSNSATGFVDSFCSDVFSARVETQTIEAINSLPGNYISNTKAHFGIQRNTVKAKYATKGKYEKIKFDVSFSPKIENCSYYVINVKKRTNSKVYNSYLTELFQFRGPPSSFC